MRRTEGVLDAREKLQIRAHEGDDETCVHQVEALGKDCVFAPENRVFLASKGAPSRRVIVTEDSAFSVYANAHLEAREGLEEVIVIATHPQGAPDKSQDSALRGLEIGVAMSETTLSAPALHGTAEEEQEPRLFLDWR